MTTSRREWIQSLCGGLGSVGLLGSLASSSAQAAPTVHYAGPAIAHKAIYLNVPWFIGRAAIYFVVWILLAMLLNFKNSRLEWKRVLRPRETGDEPAPDLHA